MEQDALQMIFNDTSKHPICEIEVGINEETEMIALFEYNARNQEAIWIRDICPTKNVDITKLTNELNKKRIFYTL